MKTRIIVVTGALGLALTLAVVAAFGPGSARVEAASAPGGAAADAAYITATVKAGESLVTFTQRFGVSADRLMATNNITNADLIQPGRVLTIPVVKTFVPSLTTPFYYTVVKGDTLYKIAVRFELDMGTISWANGLSGDIVILGRTYLMPAGPHKHTVQRNESVPAIAEKFGITQAALINANNIPNPDKLYIGQVVWIPIIYNANPMSLTGAAADLAATPVGSTATPPAPVNVAGNYIKVQVRLGESLLVYNYRYGARAYSILVVNKDIKNADLIYPGQILTIPVVVSYAPSRTTPFFYVVGGGETATSIAAKFEMTVDNLLRANPGVSIAAGATILVPAGPHLYTVKPGDSLPGIAALYNTTSANLANYSNVPNPDRIYAGTQIFIPVIYNSKPMPF